MSPHPQFVSAAPGRAAEARMDTNVFCAVHGERHPHMRECDVASAAPWSCQVHPEVVRYTAAAIVAHIQNDVAGVPPP